METFEDIRDCLDMIIGRKNSLIMRLEKENKELQEEVIRLRRTYE